MSKLEIQKKIDFVKDLIAFFEKYKGLCISWGYSGSKPKVYFSYNSILYMVTYASECKNQLAELNSDQLKVLNLKDNTPILVLDI